MGATRVRKHPLERWAEEARDGAGLFVDWLAMSVVEADVDKMGDRELRRTAAYVMGGLMTLCAAAELLDGRGHIVRMSEPLLEDVLGTEPSEGLAEGLAAEGGLPWPLFLVEMPSTSDARAVAFTTFGHVVEGIARTAEVLGLDSHGATGMAGLVKFLAEFLAADGYEDVIDIGFVPSEGYATWQADDLGAWLAARATPESAHRFATMARSFGLIPERNRDGLTKAQKMSILAFLCADNAEVRTTYAPGPVPKNPAKARRMSRATIHEAGFRWTESYREYRRYVDGAAGKGDHGDGEGRRTVRPHVRRGHWHRFWTGPREGDRKLVAHWIPPTLVNKGLADEATGNVGHRFS